MKQNPPAFGRFSEPALLILISLADGSKHGYAMIDDIERVAGVRLGPGTLYGALARLERHGLIEHQPSDDRRRPYRMTAVGATTLQGWISELQEITASAVARLGGAV